MSAEPLTPPSTAGPSATPSETPNPYDCVACRVIGVSVLMGTGFYALDAARPGRTGSRLERRIMGVVGAAFLLAGIGRAVWIGPHYPYRSKPNASSESPPAPPSTI